MARFKIPFISRKTEDLGSAGPVRKRDMPDGIWSKCPSCAEMMNRHELQASFGVCTRCNYHFQMTARERIALLSEPNTFVEYDAGLSSIDILEFTGTDSYKAKLEQNRAKTDELDAFVGGEAQLGRHRAGIGAMDFRFLGASMGSVVGEKITRVIERSTAAGLPVVLCCASGGARMYEGMFSLMQMAKTSAALSRHAEAGLAYIALLTHPTMAGVMASFATLGDVIVAEPGALIGFAGPRVIKETTQSELPPGFQRSEFLLQYGLIDEVVERKDLKARLIRLLDYLDRRREDADQAEASPPAREAEPPPEAEESAPAETDIAPGASLEAEVLDAAEAVED
jgi:acetyl-CoA carboxylase carboxyl transferase subunit beta